MQKASKSGREKVGLTTVEVFLQMCCLSTSIFERPRLFLCLQHAPITKPIYTQNSEEPVNGSFGEYMLIDTRYAPKIPEGADPYEVGPVLCAGVTVYKGLKMTEAQPGNWVVISGIGGLGHLAVQYAVAMGFRVVAVVIADDKMELAKKLGVEIAIYAYGKYLVVESLELDGGTHG